MSTITTINGTDTITSSRTVINTNFANLNSDKIETSVLDTDTALTANSDAKIATQKAVKAYIDALGSLTLKTSGVSAGPASSSTQTISHGLGRVPTVIRVQGIGSTNTSAGYHGNSVGTYTSSGNRCIYIQANSSSKDPASTTSFAIRLSSNGAGTEGNVTTGLIQNVTSTSFDIVWTSAGSVTNTVFLWEAN